MAAEIPNPFYLIIITLFSIGLILLSVGTISKFKSITTKPALDSETTVYQNYLVSSSKCFAYQDIITGRVYQEIDLNKFNKNQLLNCINPESQDYGLRISIIKNNKPEKVLEHNINPSWDVRRSEIKIFTRDSNDNKEPVTLRTEVWFNE